MACYVVTEAVILDWIRMANGIGLAFDPYCRAMGVYNGQEVATVLLDLVQQDRIYWFRGDEESQPGYILRGE